LSILATLLVGTGSQMDEVIFREFQGTGNLDLYLSQACAEQRIFPAINLRKSGTRKEHLLFTEEEYKKVIKARRLITELDEVEGMSYLIQHLDELL